MNELPEEMLQELEQLILELDKEKRNRYLEQIALIKQRIRYPDMKLAIIGDFSCGKSTFLNAVLKRPLLTMDVLPTTAVPTFIDWNGSGAGAQITLTGTDGKAHALNREGREWFRNIAKRELPEKEGELIDYLTTTSELEAVIQKVRISFPGQGGYPGFCIVDTPGVNPGEESAKGHILQTQNVLREEADAAIILFPCYCVYTHDFTVFLEQNAKHLLADSIFVVTKMDLAPEKEREKLIRFVEGRLENDFGLEHPKVYGCAAAEALRDYSENSAAESRWTAEFEQMLLEIFASLSGRREQLVAAKTAEMMENLLSELKAGISSEQENILRAKKAVETYSYDNLTAEYEKIMKKYHDTLVGPVRRTKDSLEKIIRDKVNAARSEAGQSIRSMGNSDGINSYLKDRFNSRMKEMTREIEKLCQQAGNSLDQLYEKEYTKLVTETGEMLDRYRYNTGDFHSLTGKVIDTSKSVFLAKKKEVPAVSSTGIYNDVITGSDSYAMWAFLVASFNVVGLLIGAAGRIWFWKKREETAVEVEKRVADCADPIIKQCRQNLNQVWRGYRQAGETLLKEYQEEYKTFFEEKKKDLEAYRAQSDRQIENNKRLIRELDRLNSLLMSQKRNEIPG